MSGDRAGSDAAANGRPSELRWFSLSPDLVWPSRVLLRRPALLIVALAATAVLAWLAAFRPALLLRIDRPVSVALHDQSWVPFFRVVTEVGRPWAVALLSVFAAGVFWRRCRAFAIAVPATALTGVVVDVALKVLIDRPRPPFGVGADVGPTSFPSGHVILGVVVLGLLVPSVYIVTTSRWAYRAAVFLFAVWVPLVMVSRVALGAHWFTDVVGSFFIGATLLLGAEYLVGSRHGADVCACRLHAVPGAGQWRHGGGS